jgi:hypothetical protein
MITNEKNIKNNIKIIYKKNTKLSENTKNMK